MVVAVAEFSRALGMKPGPVVGVIILILFCNRPAMPCGVRDASLS